MKLLFISFIFTISFSSYGYEVLEQGNKTINSEDLEYIVLNVSGANIIACDDHLTDPICEWERYYFESEAYPFIKKQLKDDYFPLFVSTTEIPDLMWWKEDIQKDDLVSGILVLYKGLNSREARESAAQDLAFEFLFKN